MFQKYYGLLDNLTDMKFLFKKCSVSDGQEFLRKVFDVNLYYSEGIYRTPTMLEPFDDNSLQMKEEGVLIYEKKGTLFQESPQVESRGLEPNLFVCIFTYLNL